MEIPQYPASVALGLSHKLLLQEIFHRLQPRMSEMSFANLYLFRKAHNYRLTMSGGSLTVLGKRYGGSDDYFLPPFTGDPTEATAFLLTQGLTLYCHEDFLKGNPHLEERHQIYEDRDSFDYLYLRNDLAELPGNRYHKKKNRINYFVKRNKYAVQPYSTMYRSGCIQLLDEWLRVHDATGSSSVDLESDAAREGIELAEQLGLQGVVILVEGVVKAFALGELLNNETTVCHFEKGDPFLEGIYQLVNREYSRLVFGECTYTNREQDLGEANLRETKLSYHPIDFVRKYRISAL